MQKVILFYPRPWPGNIMATRLPFSLLHLCGFTKGDDNFDITIIDESTAGDIESVIANLDGDFLCFGISSMTGIQIQNGLGIASNLKRKYPSVPIIWGGWHASLLPRQTIEHPLVDIIVRGQGEVTFRDLLYKLAGNEPLDGVEGISFQHNGQFVNNKDRDLANVLKNLRVPYDLVDVEKYIYPQPWADRTIGMITSLGCPFNCTFCAIACIYKRKVLFRNVDLVLDEIEYLTGKYGINAITFDDDNFFVSTNRLKQFCEGLLTRNIKIAWDAGAHVGLLVRKFDDDVLKLAKQAGCKQIYIGAESGSDEILTMLDKRMKVSETLEFVKKMKSLGIKPFLSTMVGFPGIGDDDVISTLDMICKCKEIDPNLGFRLFYYTPYPSTLLYERAVQGGMPVPTDLEGWSGHTLRKFKAPWISKSTRKLVKNFYAYYIVLANKSRVDINIIERLVVTTLFWFASWRMKKRCFKFPVDAYVAVKLSKLRQYYYHIRYGRASGSVLSDYE